VGSAGAAETGRGRADDGRAAALERVGLALELAAARARWLGIAGIARGLRSRRLTRPGVGLASWCALCARRRAGSASDLGFAPRLGACRRRAHVGRSRVGVTARGAIGARRRARGPVVGRAVRSAPGVEPACRRSRPCVSGPACRGAQRTGVGPAWRPGMGRSSCRLGARRAAAAEHRRLGCTGFRGSAARHGRSLLGGACGEPACTWISLGRPVGRARLGRAENRGASSSRGALVGVLPSGRSRTADADGVATCGAGPSTVEPAWGGGLQPAGGTRVERTATCG